MGLWSPFAAGETLALRSPLQRPIQRLIQSGLGLLVFGGRDLALPSFEFELEHFFFQRFEKHG